MTFTTPSSTATTSITVCEKYSWESQICLGSKFTPLYDDKEALFTEYETWSEFIRDGGLHRRLADNPKLLFFVAVFLLCASLTITIPVTFAMLFAQALSWMIFDIPAISTLCLIPLKLTPLVFSVAGTVELLAYGWWLTVGFLGHRDCYRWFKFPAYYFFAHYLQIWGEMWEYLSREDD